MSATQTSNNTESKNSIPMKRACATASQASQSASTPPARRTKRGMRGHPATPPRSSQAPNKTQAAPARRQSKGKGLSSSPKSQDMPHSSTQTNPAPKALRGP